MADGYIHGCNTCIRGEGFPNNKLCQKCQNMRGVTSMHMSSECNENCYWVGE